MFSERQRVPQCEIFLGAVAVIIVALALVILPAAYIISRWPRNPHKQGPFVVTNPSLGALPRLVTRLNLNFPNHAHWPMDKALNTTYTLELPEQGGWRVLQFVGPRVKRVPRGTGPEKVCLNYEAFKEYGYCFTEVESGPEVVRVKIAWWSEAWMLHVVEDAPEIKDKEIFT